MCAMSARKSIFSKIGPKFNYQDTKGVKNQSEIETDEVCHRQDSLSFYQSWPGSIRFWTVRPEHSVEK